MSINQNDTVLAAQDAFMDLLGLVNTVAEGDGPEGNEALCAEAQKTILMLIAAIIVVDGKYGVGEQAFVRALVDLRDKPGGELNYLNEYAVLWTTASLEVPRFFHAAVRRDAKEQTDIAQTMLRRIQLIGNYASISNGKFGVAEHETVMRYVAFLEDFIQAWAEEGLAGGQNRQARDTLDPSNLGFGSGGNDATSHTRNEAEEDGPQPRGWQSID